MIKKILTLLVGIMLFVPLVLAGGPVAEPFVVYINFEGVPVEGIDVDFICNGMTVTRTTNNLGGVLVNVGDYGDFKDVGGCTILEVDCGHASCQETFNVNDLDCPMECINTYELSEAPPEPEPECIVDSDCSTGYECVNENCIEIVTEPEPTVEDKVTSNIDNTIASVESNFGECIDVVITDTKLSKLFDGIIDFNTEDYDTHEELIVKACSETSIDDVDYGLDPFVLIEEGGIEYRYVFDDLLPLNEIEADEELEIEFLNDSIEIISLSSSKMTIRHGEVFDYLEGCVEGESIEYNGLPLTIGTIGDEFVYVTYNGDSEQIYREDTGEVGDIQVYVDESIPREDKPNICKIRIAEDIEEVIEDGDEYNEDWDYSIGEGFIGIRNSEEFKYLDEETKPLALGDKITLPNDFATVKFNEITSSESTDIDIKIRDGMLYVLGDREDDQDDSFTYNNQDYDVLYVGENILDEDKVTISSRVRIGESDVYLEAGSIIIGDLVIELDFLDILYKGVSFALDDDNYLTHEGIIFKDPEKAVNDKSTFNIIVPDEIPEITLTIGLEAETVGVEPEPVVCDDTVCTEEECQETVCNPIPCPPEPEPCKDCPEEKTCPPVTNDLAGRIITGILSLGGGLAIYFKLFNNKILLSGNTGLKTYRGRDGTLKIYHKHPGTRGYHNPQTSHRDPEKHPRGMIDVKNGYQKNSMGEWEYVG
ncbi:hypothetical protein LCGC14_1332750 [marine sediment metagenome]|uniref:Uncharacterized protein n=1 Tax=marine sediment metagenome TaxID=412755 RepID=A0A0F9MWW5_9ZZZZ